MIALSDPLISDAGSIMRETQQQLKRELSPQITPPAKIKKEVEDPILKEGQTVQIKQFQFQGVSVFDEAVLHDRLKKYLNTEQSLAGLKQAVKIIATYYREQGYLAKVYLPPQDVAEGIITIAVLEGHLGGIQLDKNSQTRLNPVFAMHFIDHYQQIGEPIHLKKLQRGVLLLNDLPGVKASSSLLAGEQKGKSIVNLNLSDTPFFSGYSSLNNTGGRSTGKNQITLVGALNNVSGYGDKVQATFVKSKGNQYAFAEYSLPIGHNGLRLGLNVSEVKYHLIDDFDSLQSEGRADNWGANFYYPIIRSAQENLYVFGAYNDKHLRDYALDQSTVDKRVKVSSIGLRGDSQDQYWGGGSNQFSFQLHSGEVDKSNNQQNYLIDQATVKTDGHYQKLSFVANRAQSLVKTMILRVNLNGQLADTNLDSSEKLSLGGPYKVRAYPAGEASGDAAIIMQLELSKNLIQSLQVFAFYDFGRVQLHHNTYTNWNGLTDKPNNYSLDGAGLGVRWQSPVKINLDATMASPIMSNEGEAFKNKNSDGSERGTRFWLSASYQV